MTQLLFKHTWSSYPDASPEVGETTALLKILIDGKSLTKNHDVFSKTIRDEIYVSLYPLALWFASSWWRLHYELLPDTARKAPSHDWRMSHEMPAANMGFVWPQILFCPDGENIQVWAQANQDNKDDAVRFLDGLNHAVSVSKAQFSNSISSMIEDVLARLQAVGCVDSDLAAIWSFVLKDSNSPAEQKKRRIEAALGFDPEDCPEDLVTRASSLEAQMGFDGFSELAGAYAVNAENRLEAMCSLAEAEGLIGKPNEVLNEIDVNFGEFEPWRDAVKAARDLRKIVDGGVETLKNSTLHDLLGLSTEKMKEFAPHNRFRASLASPTSHGQMKFVSRRPHPIAQRFELARFIGDLLRTPQQGPNAWLVSADITTARQKFQRAFAAEFLCPISSLVHFLKGDFSEYALQEAAQHFTVSERTIDALLMNNGYSARDQANFGLPYSVAF
jgi:hypothetical protein